MPYTHDSIHNPHTLLMPTIKRSATNCPTPRIVVEHPLTQMIYRFRLKKHRRHGAIHVVFEKDSQDGAGRELVVANEKVGFFDFVAAGHALLNCSHWDPATDPRYATCLPKWNPNAMHYAMKRQHETTLALHMDVLLHPHRGPRKHLDEIAKARLAQGDRPARRSGYAVARSNRAKEFILAATNALNAMLPIAQLLENTRRGALTGYTTVETARMQSEVSQILAALRGFRDIVRDNRFTAPPPSDPDRSPLPITDTIATMHPDLRFDDGDLPTPDAPAALENREPFYVDLSAFEAT